jgi:hypothetical protein
MHSMETGSSSGCILRQYGAQGFRYLSRAVDGVRGRNTCDSRILRGPYCLNPHCGQVSDDLYLIN